MASPENDPKDMHWQAMLSHWPVWASCPLRCLGFCFCTLQREHGCPLRTSSLECACLRCVSMSAHIWLGCIHVMHSPIPSAHRGSGCH